MNDREKLILYTIISHYIKTGESVGSRTIEKKYDIGVSSATIRNAMADLEDRGLISKMHTSSGRIPTNEGYRTYFDELIFNKKNNEYIDVNSYAKLKNNHVERILENVTEVLGKFSNCMAISLEPSVEKHKIRKIEIIHIDDKRAYVVAITDVGIVKTSNLSLFNYTQEEVLKELTRYINNLIISNNYTYTLQELKNFLETIGELENSFSSKEDAKLRTFNETSVFLYSNNISETINFIQDRDKLKEILKNIVKNEKYEPYDINILFGEDLQIEELKDYALMFSIYEYENERGLICLLGPSRMNYSENINLFNYINSILKSSLNNSNILKLLG